MSNDFSEKAPQKPSYIAYNVENSGNDSAKSHWQKIGAAWPTKGGGLSLKLNSIPLDGNVVLRSREELEKMRAQRGQAQAQQPRHPQL